MTRTLFLVSFFALAVSCLEARANDWPQFGGPNRDSVSSEKGLLKAWPKSGPKLVWTYADAGLGYAGAAVVGDKLYLSGGRGDSEFIFALDLKAGPGEIPKQLWETKIGPLFKWSGNSWNNGPNVTPTVDGDSLYVLGGFGDLVCVELATGKERWRVNMPRELKGEVNPVGGGLEDPSPLGWGYAWAPIVDGDKVICLHGGKRGLFAALDKRTGKVIWQSAEVTDQASYSSPMIAEIGGKRQYIHATNSGVIAVSASDGKLLWRYQRAEPYGDTVIAAPVIQDNFVFTSVGFGQGCDLIKINSEGDKFTVEKVLSDKSVQNRDGGMVLVGDHLFCHSEKGGWLCQEFKTGKQLWAEKRKLERGSLSYADGNFYCCGEEGHIVLLEASTKSWTEHGRFKLPKASAHRLPSGRVWTHPVIANGRLYLRDQEFLFSYDIAAH